MDVGVGLIWGSPDLFEEREEAKESEGEGRVEVGKMEVIKWEVKLGR